YIQSLLLCMLAAAYPSCKVPEFPLACQGQCMCPSHSITYECRLVFRHTPWDIFLSNHSSFPQLRTQAVLIIVQPVCKHFHCIWARTLLSIMMVK
ncbi:hypothetical protein BC830DRAFT_1122508, partial [Chytriomyces sp. MP71]